MTRDEWMVLPDGARLHRSLDGRRYFEACGAVYYCCPSASEALSTGLPLAEFEALLFGCSPGSGEYERAAVAYAEAWGAYWNAPGGSEASSEALRSTKVTGDAFLALYREREARRG